MADQPAPGRARGFDRYNQIRLAIAVAYGVLAGLGLAIGFDAAGTAIGGGLGVAVGMWYQVPKIFKIGAR